jgi:hypothetical protein
MTRPSDKDLYAILGVAPDATSEQIRDAYRARARIVHPDRFDRQRQPKDWQGANEMLAELNGAYAILSDAGARRDYDEIRARGFQRQQPPPPPPPKPRSDPSQPQPSPFQSGDLTPGHAKYADLPSHVRSRLLSRQAGQEKEQFQVKLESVAWNYLFIPVLMVWFWYLLEDADGPKWKGDTLLWYGGLTLAVGWLIGRNVVTIIRWTKSTLKPHYYVTPIYFIKTEYDIVSFWPIWELRNISVTHKHRNGAYQSTDVTLKFDGHDESLSLSPKARVEAMFDRMKGFDSRVRAAFKGNDHQYFRAHDDFAGVSRGGIPSNVILSQRAQVLFYTAAVALCSCVLFVAIAVNEDLSENYWVRHPIPVVKAPLPSAQASRPSIPEQPLPLSGSIRTFTTAEREAPFEIKAAQGSNYLLKLVDAFTKAPVLTVFVRSGATVNIDVPLGVYEVRYASGEAWYGDEYLFGPDTAYSKADKTFTFEAVGNQVRGFTITLYKVAHGNLRTAAIKPTEF